MHDQPIRVETRGHVGLITLNRPRQLNAVNDVLMDALGAVLRAFDADASIGAIVITGSPKAFTAGADIEAMADWSFMDVCPGAFITRNWETIRRVRKPVLAAVAGFAMGGGCELVPACGGLPLGVWHQRRHRLARHPDRRNARAEGRTCPRWPAASCSCPSR